MSTLLTGDDAILILENDVTFYHAWYAVAEQAARHFFCPRQTGNDSPSISIDHRHGALSYSAGEMMKIRISNLTRSHLERLLDSEPELADTVLTGDSQHVATAYFVDKLRSEVMAGHIQAPQDIMHTLATLYGQAGGNVAKTSRITGLSRHVINKHKAMMDTVTYERMLRVKQGEPYARVMADCQPYSANAHHFTPVFIVREDDDAQALIQPGDLVSQSGSSRWHEVGKLGCHGRLIYGVKGIHHLPCKVLPKRYADVAGRFCSTVDGVSGNDYAHQHKKLA